MEFTKFLNKFQNNFEELTKGVDHLYEVNVDKDVLWNLYLDSFPEGTNNIYKTRREYDCSCCRHFIKDFGSVVAIKNNKMKTIWDFDCESSTFQPVINALNAFIKSQPITNLYITFFNRIGTPENRELLEDGSIKKWNHFYIDIPSKFVNRNSHRSIGDLQGDFRDTRNVFKRSLDELTTESVETVLELISSNSLYKGKEWETVLTQFLKYKKEYTDLSTEEEKDNYAWVMSAKAGNVIGRIRNHSIGTLLTNISIDIDLDTAVKKYEDIVAPSNYKRPKAIFTQKMLNDAKKTIEELGYMESLGRRYATLDDITVNNILFSNKDSAKRIKGTVDIFDDMSKNIPMNPKKFSKIEEVTIDNFINNILPTAREIEAFVENKHSSNFVSLIAPTDKNSKTMFKWDNNFSWAYSGNMTDSSMKENVKNAGGNVNGDLRFSIQWNDEDYNPNDFDAHCLEPNGNHIFYINKNRVHTSSGMLDVDIICPVRNIPAVENITYSNKSKMPKGIYYLYVHCFNHKGGRSGFKSEIEFGGQIYQFNYNKELKDDEKVYVAEVTWDGNNFTIKELIPSNLSSKEIWGLKTNNFVPVSVICYSPNYWDEQNGIGHKHYMFMLKDCINPESPNGFYNEFLKQELVQHKRVFEALGGKMKVEDTKDQLSGIAFSSTKRNELIVKVKGSTERTLKIKF